jgi:hypothetical protein
VTSLAWESIAMMRVRLEIEENQLRFNRSLIEMERAHRRRNAALWTRWDDEARSCAHRQQRLAQNLLGGDPSLLVRGRWELDQLRRAHANFVPRKQQLEMDLLRVQQRYDECMRAFHSADDAEIVQTWAGFESDRARCATDISDFQRDYLTVGSPGTDTKND